MIQWLVSLLRIRPAWPMTALLLVGFLLCSAGFDWRHDQLDCDMKLLDARGWYSPAEARDLFDCLGDEGRRLYAITEVTLDLFFPFIYGMLFGLLILQLYKEPVAGWLILVPLIAVFADLLENSLVAYLLWTFDGRASSIAWAAAILTLVKTFALIGALVVILVRGAMDVFGKTRPSQIT